MVPVTPLINTITSPPKITPKNYLSLPLFLSLPLSPLFRSPLPLSLFPALFPPYPFLSLLSFPPLSLSISPSPSLSLSFSPLSHTHPPSFSFSPFSSPLPELVLSLYPLSLSAPLSITHTIPFCPEAT